ncbi:MAG: carbohydrate ABC transporter substrate-binding protein [Candidatus Rokubacteria bacterium]|nr:carbohydrate ABC transporter substrate-binding protein [Candidatus Rokubacteria bacterium]
MSTRREFLTVTLGAAAAAGFPPSRAGAAPKAMTVIHESSFIKPFDDFFVKTLAPAYEKQTGIKINYEPASVGSLLTRLTTIIETKSGPEILHTGLNFPWLFDAGLADVTDIANEVGKKLGGWHEIVLEGVVVNKKWKALPWGNIGQLEVYRTDWFKEVGVTKFPDTWEDLLAAGRLLKKKGHPFGFELGHGFGDNHGWLYPLLWSYGGREVDKDGKTVLIDSDETAKAIDFCRRFYQETMFEDVLGWTDVNNNKAFFGEQISCTNNASSILVVGKRDFPEIAKVTDHGLNPTGPKGRFHMLNPQGHALGVHAPDQAAAKAFLRWLYDDKQLNAWLISADAYYAPFLRAYDNHPMWNPEPRYIPYRESVKTSHLPGWPGPPSHAMAESLAKYVVVDMFAKACQGTSTKDVIATAVTQLKQIYKAK